MDGVPHKRYLVGVRCMTYNQSSYITDALDGFVMQQTRFPYVCLIFDDASTDGEQEVIRTYLDEHFDRQDESAFEKETDYGQVLFSRHKSNRNCYFAVFLLKENHYSQRKDKLAYYRGWLDFDYFALCEGDDYWTDPFKLQKQLDYMEASPGCMLSVHAAAWRTGDEVFPYGCVDSVPKDYPVEELIRVGGFYFATASFVFRSELDYDFPAWRQKAGVGDYPLQILAGLRGTVHYMPDSMCVYRFQREGSWSYRWQQDPAVNLAYQKNKIEWMTLFDEATGHQYRGAVYNLLFSHYNSLFNAGEMGFWPYAQAVFRMKEKRYGRLLKDLVRYCCRPVSRLRKRSHAD